MVLVEGEDVLTLGEKFEHNGATYYVGWMRSEDGKNQFGMWINEQPNGGFEFSFLDFKPDDEMNYRKIYILAEDPRECVEEHL